MKSKTGKIILVVSLIGNLILLGVLATFVKKQGGTNYVKSVLHIPYDQPYNQNPQYIGRTELFNQLTIPQDFIVFLGDSLTQRSEWNEMFNSNKIVNRGIESDTTEGVLHRLDSITAAKPSKIFLMIGINDLRIGKEVNDVIKNYSKILETIHTKSPNTEIYVQSILPVNNKIVGDIVDNSDVTNINKHLKRLAEKYNYGYIDLYSKFSQDNQLKSELTIDGIHLKGQGYKIWKSSIERELKK
ncbi:GDSL-type esterase/lipase family protein [Priestia megaterium]|uniref:GDSL-type esterase/lipase family protein n=1 Tax=Priestia megaterium TaxID=1404 RepID=UPI000BF7195B|nr:GDSL-type esterase/lipase family protein [Priestia megaterium]PFJ03213.1 lipase [Priestia megaterium]PGR11748.1 lipase [Priestia megaterium]